MGALRVSTSNSVLEISIHVGSKRIKRKKQSVDAERQANTLCYMTYDTNYPNPHVIHLHQQPPSWANQRASEGFTA